MKEQLDHINHRDRPRLSLLELANRIEPDFGLLVQTQKNKRNSSIEGGAKRVTTDQSQSTKSIGLTFNKNKSRRSIVSKESKENKSSNRNIDDETTKLYFTGAPPRKPGFKSKFYQE